MKKYLRWFLSMIVLFAMCPFTSVNAEERMIELAFRILDENGKDCTGGLLDVNDTYTYEISYHHLMDEEEKLIIEQKLPEEAAYVVSSDGGLITTIDGQKYVRWVVHGEDGKVTSTFQVNQNAYGKQIKSEVSGTTYDAYEQPLRTILKRTNTAAVWNAPIISVLDQNGSDINYLPVGRDETVHFWIGVTNPTEQKQNVKVTVPVDRRISTSVSSITDGGSMQGTDVIYHLSIEAGQTKMIGYQLYVPKLENDLFLYQYANIEFSDLSGNNTKQTNTVNITLGHQVGLDEDFTIKSGKEKTIINQNREAQRRIEKQKQQLEAQQNAVKVDTVVRKTKERNEEKNIRKTADTNHVKAKQFNQQPIQSGSVNTGGSLRMGHISVVTGMSFVPLFLFTLQRKRRE